MALKQQLSQDAQDPTEDLGPASADAGLVLRSHLGGFQPLALAPHCGHLENDPDRSFPAPFSVSQVKKKITLNTKQEQKDQELFLSDPLTLLKATSPKSYGVHCSSVGHGVT